MMFSIYVMFKNMSQMEFLKKSFDTDLGKLYEIICILQAVELVSEHYKDERAGEKIKKKPELLHQPLNLKDKAHTIPIS